MIGVQGLITAFSRNSDNLHTYLNGLTQADALVQPPVQGNCILWITGHIVHYRGFILTALQQQPVIDSSITGRYARGSEPVLGVEPNQAQLEALVNGYDQAQPIIVEALQNLTPEQSQEVITIGSFTMPRGELVLVYARHEAQHIGQFELLREIALHARSPK